MILMTKYDIYTMFRNLYAKHGIVIVSAAEAFHLDIHADQLPEDLALNVRKSALIFNLLCGAPELWNSVGETDVFLMCGWDTYYLTTLMPHKVAYFHKLKTERQQIATAAGVQYNDIMLMPIAYYLNLANSVAYQNIYRSQFTAHVGSATQQTAEDLYGHILVALQNTASAAERNRVERNQNYAIGSLVHTCAKLEIELEKPNHARSTGDLIREVDSNGLKALYCFWNCIRAPYMPFEDLCFLIGVKNDAIKINIFDKLGDLGATVGAIYETVKLDGAPLRAELPDIRDIHSASISELVDAVGSSSDIYGAILDAVGDKSLNRTQVKNVLHVFVQWINDSFIGRNNYATQTQDEGSPFTDRVVQWLADLLRPKTIHWLTRDPIADVLSAAAKATACKHPTIDAKELAGDLYELHFQNKLSGAIPPLRVNIERLAALPDIDDLRSRISSGGFIETLSVPDGGMIEPKITADYFRSDTQYNFSSALTELIAASRRSHSAFTDTLKALFGEKVRLSPVPFEERTAAGELIYVNDSRTRKYLVLWASTGNPVIANSGRNDVIKLRDPRNVEHLRHCYAKMHSQPSETMPCSHFTSRPT